MSAEEREAYWSVARFGLAARHLGRFSGRSLLAPLPDAPWLSRGCLRGRAEQNAAFWSSQATGRPGPARPHLPGGLIDRARRVRDERHRLLDALDRLPQILVHGDADRRNFSPGAARRRGGDCGDRLGLDMGVAALGEELVNLVAASVLWFQAEVRVLPALAEACLDGFSAGLADAGWQGDARRARTSFAIGTALRFGPLGPFTPMLQYPEMGRAMARSSGYEPEELADCMAAVQRFAYDQLDAVRSDLAAL